MTAQPNNYNCYLFHDGGLYHIETSPLICFANQWTCFYVTGTSVMTELTFSQMLNKVLNALMHYLIRVFVEMKRSQKLS